MDLQQYQEAIRLKVCARCIDGDGHGNCRLDPSANCPLLEYLPLIVSAVSRVNSNRVEDYVAELRGIVCAQCVHESADGTCVRRKEVECALDRYFPLVIQAIEELHQTA